MKTTISFKAEYVIETIDKLEKRVVDRFPNSSLKKIVNEVQELVKESQKTIEWLDKPNYLIRISSAVIIAIGLGGLIYSLSLTDLKISNTKITNIITVSEAVFNDIILISAAIFFLSTLELRFKRKKTLKALNDLRVIIHVIDMHQLTKDPTLLIQNGLETKHSPKRTMTKFELQRYLDYCSELSAMISKIGVLYSQALPDKVVISAVNEIETLSTGLSRKIWQKLIILNDVEEKGKSVLEAELN